MSQVITARLSRNDAQPWGFRLQGGKDFGTPLVIQKVNTGSIADHAGLKAGDAVVRLNTTELYNLRHKDAQDAIVRAGPTFELVVQRGGATWKPSITPVASPILGNYSPVTKTSLAATNKQQVSNFGSGHNTAARPFQIPPSPVRSIGNKQYNTPVAMYSDETIAETLSSQAEVLAGGVLGVNFKKNEKVYNPEKSEVLKALQENDSEPEPAELPSIASSAPYQPPPQQHQPQPQGVTKHVHAPVDRPISNNNGGLPAGQNICADCERLIVGVFVRIKDKNLHVECFKCATCGTNLKNQGYFNLHNKLYCDIHARLAALTSPPPNAHANGLVPVTFPTKNVGVNAISSALSAHAGNLNGNTPSNFTAPKPFSYSAPGGPPMAAPKSPSSYPPPVSQQTWAPAPSSWSAPAQPAWSPPSAAAPAAPKPAVPVQASFAKKPSFNLKGSVGTPGALPKHGRSFTTSGPNRGQGVLNQPTGRMAVCGGCSMQVRGPFITALGRTWCPAHFLCVNPSCKRELVDIGFVEEKGDLYCEYCFEQFLAPPCGKCNGKIKGDCLNAIGKKFHPECFKCTYCGKLFGNSPFFLEEGDAYCEADWNELFTTKCFACGFPVEAGDRWVEALNNNYHSQCFNCTYCKKNLEGQSFFSKGGRPFCKNHAR